MDNTYHKLYQQLLNTLGHVTEGGTIGFAAHIGATAVSTLGVQSPLDLMLVVEPFPLAAAQMTALETIGYGEPTTLDWSQGQRLIHEDGHHLFIHWWADDTANDHVLLRDYLRNSEQARERYLATRPTDKHQDWKRSLFPQLVEEAHRWWTRHDNFASLHRLLADLSEFPHPWYISSGWALDLFLGKVSRFHEDVDIVVARQDQLALHQYMHDRKWHWLTPFTGKLEPWPPHMWIELPRHQLHAHRLHDHGENEFLDFLLTDFQGDIWRYRREPSIVQSVERMHRTTAEGLRYLVPEVVLLFKSRNTGMRERSKDQEDFARVLPQLESDQRAWLRWALLVTQPEHDWLAQLA